MNNTVNRIYVSVDCEKDIDGVETPTVLYWHDGRRWPIKRVLHETVPDIERPDEIRYTILIGSLERYLYKDESGWFVIPPR